MAEKAAKELAFALFDEDKRPSDPEVKSLGIKSKTRYNYFQEWKKAHSEQDGSTPEGTKGTPDEPKGTPSKAGVATSPVTVGRITITTENWGFTQYGAILLLDTHNKAKRDIEYGGTIGEFICDMCEFYRRILNYTELEYARAITKTKARAA